MSTISHKNLFEKLRDTSIIERCVQYAHWTLPQIMADFENARGDQRVVLERDYQEIGALLTNNLASKITRLLFPASQPFFRINLSDALKALAQASNVKPNELQARLARLEMAATLRLFMNASYSQLILALKHLIITGNALLYRDAQSKRTTTYGLQSFVVRRDGKGEVLDCVLREFTYVEALDPEVQKALQAESRSKYSRPEQQVEVYTRIQRKWSKAGKKVYEVTQEVDTLPVGEPSTYPEHLCPWRVVTWSLLAGEHYGRGMVEDYAGGFAKLSDLSEAHALYGIEVMRVVHLVGAGSGTDIDDLANAETGEYVRGDPESVNAHESGDAAKLQQVAAEIAEVFSRLARAFMYGANTRDAERVTAYELQQDALEAENTLGGVYSSLADTLQTPLAHLLLVEEGEQMLEGLITGDVKLDISAGIPALGRSTDVQNLVGAAQEAAAIAPVLAQVDSRVSAHRVMDMIYAGRSVDTALIMKSEDELEVEKQADEQVAAGQEQIMQATAAADQLQQVEALQQI